MKVLLINISLRPTSHKIIFPIGPGYIATAIHNAGHDLTIYDLDALRPTDREIEEYIKNANCDVVAMGCMVTGYKYVKKLCRIVKKYHQVPIIIGNSVATSIPEILLNHTKADIGVVGEGDVTIVELLRALENKTPLDDVKGIFFRRGKEIIFTPDREVIPDLSVLPVINYDLFDMKTYMDRCRTNITEPYPIEYEKIRALPVNTARGCIFNCTFCYHVFKMKRYRTRPIEIICKEIKYLQQKYGVNYVQFFDELTLYSRLQALEFAEGILKSGLKFWWSADCRAGLFREGDLDLALKLKKARCMALGYSLESADKDILKDMNKFITVEQFAVQTRILKQAGILPVTSIVIGYPKETLKTIKKTFDVCYELGVYPSTGYLLPQPKTVMYEYAKKKGLIPNEEDYVLKMGDRQDYTINLTDALTREQMENAVQRHLKRLVRRMRLGLDEQHLLKTGHYVSDKRTTEKIVGVIAARMGSKRRPGKVMSTILGTPMLQLLIERVKRAKYLDHIVVATTKNKKDDVVAQLARNLGVGEYRGSETDVLGRVLKAAEKYDGKIIVRLTGDNPLTDPLYIDKGVKIFLTGKYDYVGNTGIELTMPRGFDVEVVATEKLREAAKLVKDRDSREHVTLYFRRHPEKFRLKAFGPVKKDRVSNLHLAVDTEKDLRLIRQIFEKLYKDNPTFDYGDVIGLLDRQPRLKAISQTSFGLWEKNSTPFLPSSWRGNGSRHEIVRKVS